MNFPTRTKVGQMPFGDKNDRTFTVPFRFFMVMTLAIC